jgi:hypothetical protein
MATGHNTFSVVEEISSPVFCKIAAPVSPRRGYPKLPDLSGNPRPYSIYRYQLFFQKDKLYVKSDRIIMGKMVLFVCCNEE